MRFFKQNPHSFLLGMLCLALLMGLQACQQQSIGTIQGVAKLQDRVDQEGIQILIPGTQFRAITDVTGQFTIQGIPRGTYTVVYKQEGFNPQRQEFEITSSKTVALDTVTLTKKQEPAGRMAGVVKLEGETQHNNILVSLLGTPHNTKTDPQGLYKFSEITPGEYQLLALKDGWLPATRDSLRVQDGEQTDVEPIELASIAKIQSATQAAKMEGEAILRGVAFLEGETDHDGIQVTLENYPDKTAKTNANGVFKLTGLDTNPHTLIFSHPGYLEERIPNAMPVDASSTATVGYITLQKDIEEQRGFGILQGHVYLEGQESHENTIVRLLGISQSVVTNADGRYMFIGIPSGTYVLTAEHPGYQTGRQSDIQLKPENITPVPDMTLQPATQPREGKGTIRGVALLEGEADHGGIGVAIQGTSMTAATAQDGSFVFENVPTGAYSLIFSKGGFKNTYYDGVGLEPGQTVQLEPVVLQKDVEPPVVIETFPRQGARRVPITYYVDVIVRFSERMMGDTVKRSVVIDPPVSYEAFFDRESEFSNMDVLHLRLYQDGPDPVQFKTRYTVTITPSAATPKGVSLTEPYRFHFTTDGPLILRTIPEDGADRFMISYRQPIMIETNAPVDPTTVSRAIRFRPQPDAIPQFQTMNVGIGSRIFIKTNLRSNTRYRMQIDTKLRTTQRERFSNTPMSVSFETIGPDDEARFPRNRGNFSRFR